jgi:ABC-2 type transport system ATP-binding protein
MSINAVEIRALHKTYKASRKYPAKTALHSIDLDIPRGSIFGLLGPNGAGKSTIINIMAGLVVKTSGSVKIWDTDLDEAPKQIKSAIGVVPQEINFDPFFTPAQLLDIQAGLYGIPPAERRTAQLLKMVKLEAQANAYARTLSGGMRRRLMVAKAMVHTPPVLVLDEPTAGVDVELRRGMWENIRELQKAGTTILLTTHYLEEAEMLCDRIAIIDHGRIIANETKETMLARLDKKTAVFRLDRPVSVIPAELAPFGVEAEGERSLKCTYAPRDAAVGRMIEAIVGAGYGIADITTRENDLEDVFLQLTGHRAA